MHYIKRFYLRTLYYMAVGSFIDYVSTNKLKAIEFKLQAQI